MNSSKFSIGTGSLLVDLHPEQRLWKFWLDAQDDPLVDLPEAFRATRGLNTVLKKEEKAPEGFLPLGYAEQLAQDPLVQATPAADRDLIVQNLNDLVSGASRAVVTGQQPGFAGGPLYSLYKIATTVALARLRTQKGLPSVPVYWMGDDDDDLAEALDPVLWDGLTGTLASSHCPVPEGNKRQQMIGTLTFDRLEHRVGEILKSQPTSDGLGQDLVDIYLLAQSENVTISELNESLIRRIFRGTGLVILRGNDSRLHHHSAEFYTRVVPLLDELARVTGLRTFQLAKELDIPPLGANSLKRPLYQVDNQSRVPWNGQDTPANSFGWRCGVLLRSMLQDWLLKPVAVVVGPGELAYLSQLTPAYELLGLTRAPLIPRLFGWLIPHSLDHGLLKKFSHTVPLTKDEASKWALEAGLKAEDELVIMLSGRLNISPERARTLAAGRTRRWVKGVQTMLQNESQRKVNEERPSTPAWVFPLGKRQERKLAWVPCVATWGQRFVDCLLEASDRHLQCGLEGQWNEYLLQVQEPALWFGKGENT